MSSPLEHIKVEFSEGGLMILNISIAFIMFGVALGVKLEDFKEMIRNPKGAISGIVSQFILLPAVTFLLVWIFRPLPGIALGMILVAACPGGNVSNFFSSVARGNIALSVALTGFATLLATFMTPLNVEFWGSILPETSQILTSINLDFLKMFKTVALILVIPLVLGIFVARRFPILTIKITKPIRYISFAILLVIITMVFYNNFDLFLEYYDYIIYIVLIHNALAFATGYFFSKSLRNTAADVRSITIETGIQNSGLGLIIIFNFFDGHGGMALITAWWGVWHIISGFIVSKIFSFRPAFAETSNAEI